jgi:hypothetical protein
MSEVQPIRKKLVVVGDGFVGMLLLERGLVFATEYWVRKNILINCLPYWVLPRSQYRFCTDLSRSKPETIAELNAPHI